MCGRLLPCVSVESARELTSQNIVVQTWYCHVMQHVHGVYSNVQIAAVSKVVLLLAYHKRPGFLQTYCVNKSSSQQFGQNISKTLTADQQSDNPSYTHLILPHDQNVQAPPIPGAEKL